MLDVFLLEPALGLERGPADYELSARRKRRIGADAGGLFSLPIPSACVRRFRTVRPLGVNLGVSLAVHHAARHRPAPHGVAWRKPHACGSQR